MEILSTHRPLWFYLDNRRKIMHIGATKWAANVKSAARGIFYLARILVGKVRGALHIGVAPFLSIKEVSRF
jgi:hypothetical protein